MTSAIHTSSRFKVTIQLNGLMSHGGDILIVQISPHGNRCDDRSDAAIVEQRRVCTRNGSLSFRCHMACLVAYRQDVTDASMYDDLSHLPHLVAASHGTVG